MKSFSYFEENEELKNKECFHGIIGYLDLKPCAYTFNDQKVKFSKLSQIQL